MSSPLDPLRRTFMTALTTLPMGGIAAPSGAGAEMRRLGSRTLVIYFSRTGNTRVIAGLIHRALHTDLFEIRPATPYPEDYLETLEEARQERDTGRERALKAQVSNIADYETVFVGFPIWGETTPPIIRAFLSGHNLSGKTLVPFVTHGGYGLGNSESVLASHAPKARLHASFVMEADQERRTMDQVNLWLRGIKING